MDPFKHFCLVTGALVVFGGQEGGGVYVTLEYLNRTAWITEPLKYGHNSHAMVLLPCP